MSIMREIYMEQERENDEAAQTEAEEWYAIMDALQSAKNLGLSTEHLTTLCRSTGTQLDDLED